MVFGTLPRKVMFLLAFSLATRMRWLFTILTGSWAVGGSGGTNGTRWIRWWLLPGG